VSYALIKMYFFPVAGAYMFSAVTPELRDVCYPVVITTLWPWMSFQYYSGFRV